MRSQNASKIAEQLPILTSGELARRANCTPQTIRNSVRSGKLAGTRVGERFVFHESEAERFLASREGERAKARA